MRELTVARNGVILIISVQNASDKSASGGVLLRQKFSHTGFVWGRVECPTTLELAKSVYSLHIHSTFFGGIAHFFVKNVELDKIA